MDLEPRRAQQASEQEDVEWPGLIEPAPRASAAIEHRLDALAAHGLDVFLVLEQDAERLVDRARRRARRDRAPRAPRPSPASPTRPPVLYSSAVRSSCTNAVTCSASRAGHPGSLAATMRCSVSAVRIVDPAVDAAALQRVVDLARAVRRDDDDRRLGGADRPELGNGDLEVGQQLEQVALELFVGAVDLVDEQDRRPRSRLLDRAQQRPLDQERVGEQLSRRRPRIQRVRALEQPNLEDLPRVVPLVDGVADVEPLVALQANQLGVERRTRAPSPPRSCRRQALLRETAAAAGAARGRSRRQALARRCTAARPCACCRSSTDAGIASLGEACRERSSRSLHSCGLTCAAVRSARRAPRRWRSARLVNTGATARRYSADA